MNPIIGQNVVFKVYKDGEYRPFLCAMDCSISPNVQTKEVRTEGNGQWKKVRGQKLSYRVSISGLIPFNELDPSPFYLLESYMLQMLHVPFQMLFEDPFTALIKIIQGEALIVDAPFTGPVLDFANASFEMEGSGAFTILNSTTVCSATIGSIVIGNGNVDIGADASFTYSGIMNAARLEYSVDGGAREVIFNPGGADGLVYLYGLSEGSHTLEVWAVCENGLDGESNEQIFETGGGGDPVACAVPGTPEVSELTGSSTHFEWAASPSTPGNYYWELVFVSTGNVAAFATTGDTQTDIFGMIPGVDYIFRVKSICEEGVSESSFVQVEFTSEAPVTCNVPGSPVMSAITTTTATATWTSPSPVPASGYAWEVLNGITVIDSGTTSSLSVGLTGLPSGTSLTFRVKSVCGVGNESGWNSVGFNTTASCQTPENLSVGSITGTTATVSWTEPSPAPASGYQWILIEYPSMTIVQSGSVGFGVTSVNLTSLTPATQYDINVRSNCGGGSFSSYATETFVTM